MKPYREILKLAWPSIATNITTPLLSLADTAVVGHMKDSNAMAAVALGAVLFNVLYWVFAFLRMGTSGFTAQTFGAGDYAESRRYLVRGLTVALLGGAAILVVSWLAAPRLLALVDSGNDPRVLLPATRYFDMAVLGAPAVLITYVVSGWLLGMQQSRPIMWVALATNVLNIALSVAMVYIFDMGVRGVGLATALAQWAGAALGLMAVLKIWRRHPGDGWHKGVFDGYKIRRMMRVNSDIFVRTVCLAAVVLWFTHAGAAQSPVILAANALLMQFFMFFSYFMDGFAFAGEAIAGKYAGKGSATTVTGTIRALMRIGAAIAGVFTFLYLVFGSTFASWLTDEPGVLGSARHYIGWIVCVPFAGFAAFVWDGIYVGLTLSRRLLTSMAAGAITFFAVYLGLHHTLGNHALWLAFILYLAMRGIASTILYRRH